MVSFLFMASPLLAEAPSLLLHGGGSPWASPLLTEAHALLVHGGGSRWASPLLAEAPLLLLHGGGSWWASPLLAEAHALLVRGGGSPRASPLLAEAHALSLRGGSSRCSRSTQAFPTHHLSSHWFPNRHHPWLEVNGWGEQSRPAVPNLFDNRNRFHGRRQFLHGWGWGSCFR